MIYNVEAHLSEARLSMANKLDSGKHEELLRSNVSLSSSGHLRPKSMRVPPSAFEARGKVNRSKSVSVVEPYYVELREANRSQTSLVQAATQWQRLVVLEQTAKFLMTW